MLREAQKIFTQSTPINLKEANDKFENIEEGTPEKEKYKKAMQSLIAIPADNPDFPGTLKTIENKLHSINRAIE